MYCLCARKAVMAYTVYLSAEKGASEKKERAMGGEGEGWRKHMSLGC